MPEGNLFNSLVRLFLSLAVVFGLLFVLRRYALRHANAPLNAPSRLLHIRERVWLGPRAQAALLQVGDKTYLVCLSDSAVQLTEVTGLARASSQEGMPTSEFAAELKDTLSFLRQGGKK